MKINKRRMSHDCYYIYFIPSHSLSHSFIRLLSLVCFELCAFLHRVFSVNSVDYSVHHSFPLWCEQNGNNNDKRSFWFLANTITFGNNSWCVNQTKIQTIYLSAIEIISYYFPLNNFEFDYNTQYTYMYMAAKMINNSNSNNKINMTKCHLFYSLCLHYALLNDARTWHKINMRQSNTMEII